jgi:hypothetical protein
VAIHGVCLVPNPYSAGFAEGDPYPGHSRLTGPGGEEQLSTNRDLVYKEGQFNIIAIAVLLLTFSLAAIYHPTPP